MDNVKQVGQILRKKRKESAQNVRRQSENFPLVERSVSGVNPIAPYTMTFPLSDNPHQVSVNLYIRENQLPCEPLPLEEFAGGGASCGSVDGAGVMHYLGFTSNIGGFELIDGKLKVPVSGYYTIHQVHTFGGVGVAPPSAVFVGITVNNSVVKSELFTFPGELAPAFATSNLYETVFIPAGSFVTGVILFDGIAFQSPFNLCGFGVPSFISVTLVGDA